MAESHRTDFSESRMCATILLACYIIILIAPLVFFLFISQTYSRGILRAFGNGAAFTGFSLLALQVVIGSRLKFIDRPFGIDRVLRFHKKMAMLGALLILAHPVLLALNVGNTWLFSSETPLRINLGKLGLTILIAGIAFAMLFRTLRVQYNLWHITHKAMILVVALGFLHIIFTGSDMNYKPLKILIWLIFLIAVAAFIWRNALVLLIGRRRFSVDSVSQVTHDTWNIEMKPADNSPFTHHPGQFIFLKLLRPGRSSEEHPFTISSSPKNELSLSVTVKESGDFTRTIGKTRVGDTAFIMGPYGRFSHVFHDVPAFLFIAGGVGITPILSMMRYLRDTSDLRKSVLIYGNKTAGDIIFRGELEDMPKNVAVHHVLSNPESGWEGMRGFITSEVIRECAGEILDSAHIFLCGPPVMMDKVISTIKELGINRNCIHFERFAL